MTATPFEMKWDTHGHEAEHLVTEVIQHLDGRKKHLKDTAKNREVITSILAHKMGDFQVKLTDTPSTHKETLRETLECLTGPVLTQSKGKGKYALREAYAAPTAQFITKPLEASGRPAPPITTRFGTIYRDGSHSEVPFEDIRLFGYSRPSLVQIVAPHQHWYMFVGNEPTPSANWQHMAEAAHPHECHHELMDLIANQGNMRGIATTRYGEDGFLAINPDSVLFTIDTTLIRFTGKSGHRPLLNITDIYQRQHIRWGSKAKA